MHNIRKTIIIVAAFLFLAFFGFRLFDMFKDSILEIYNIRWKLSITREIQIDFYGGVIPTVFSLFIVFYLVSFREFSIRQYLHYFLLSIAFGIMVSRVSSTAIITFYKVLALLVSLLAVFLTFYDRGFIKFLKFRDFRGLDFTKRNYVNSLLLAYTYASLSVLVVDLVYVPFVVLPYIGAMGLTDGIMLSGLFTPLSVTLVTLLVMFLYEIHAPDLSV